MSEDRASAIASLETRLEALCAELAALDVIVVGATRNLRDDDPRLSHAFGNALGFTAEGRALAVKVAVGVFSLAPTTAKELAMLVCEELMSPLFGALKDRGFTSLLLLEHPDQTLSLYSIRTQDKGRARLIARALQWIRKRN